MNPSLYEETVDVPSLSSGLPRTRLRYEYRDADNYKQHGQIVLSSPADAVSARRLLDALDPHDFFVPTAVGIADLQKGMGDWNPDTDHPFHSLTSIALTDEPATEERGFAQLVDAFEAADWLSAALRVEEAAEI